MRNLSVLKIVTAALLLGTLSQGQAASGTWSTDASGNWSDTAKWTGGTVADGDTFTADFSTLNITANRTVTLDSARTLSVLKFGDAIPGNNWTVSGSSGLTLGTAATVSVSNQTATLSVPLAGTAGVTKIGNGTLVIGGAASTLTGAIVNRAGAIKLDYTLAGSPSTNMLPSTLVVSNAGGALTLVGNSSVPSQQTFATNDIGPGLTIITASEPTAANTPELDLGYLTYQLGGTVRFVGPGTVDGTGSPQPPSGIITTLSTNGVTTGTAPWGLIYPGSTVSGNFSKPAYAGLATVGLYDWASTYTAGGVQGTSPYTIIGGSQVTGFYVTTMPNGNGNWDIAANTSLSTGTKFAHTARFNTPTATTLTLQNAGTGNTPSILLVGGILITPNLGATNVIMQPGTQAGSFGNWQIQRVTTPTGSQEGVIWQNNTNGFFNVVCSIPDGRDAGDVNHIVVSGEGTTTFYGVNGYSGQTYVNGGSLGITNGAGLGSVTAGAAVNLSGGTLFGFNGTFFGVATNGGTFITLDNAGANKRAVNLLGGGGALAALPGTVLNVGGVVGSAAGVGPLTIGVPPVAANGFVSGLLPGTGPGTGNTNAVYATGTVALSGGNFYTGGTIVRGGATLNINGINALGGANYNGLTLDNGTLQYTNAFSGNGSGDLTSIGTAGLTIGNGGATIDVNGNTVTYVGSIGNSGAGALTVTSTGASGVLDLQSANTYTGGTLVAGGTLKANNPTGSATGPGAVTVTNGGTLGGNGSISGAVTVLNNGALAAGNSVGKLTVGTLALQAGSLVNVELNATPTNDLVVVSTSGGLTLNGGVVNLYAEGGTTPWTTLGTYNLIQYSGSIAGTGLDATWTTASASNPHIGNPQSGYVYAFSASGGFIKVTITAGASIGTWGVDADGNWSLASNWTATSGTMPPNANGAAAIFGVGTAFHTVTVNSNITVGGVTLNNDNSFALAGAGKTLTVNNGGGTAVVSVTGGTSNSISTAVALSDNVALNVASGKVVALSGNVANTSGAKTLAITGPGTVALAGNNTYGPATGSTGTTLTNGVTVQVGSSTAFGAGDVVMTSSSTLKVGTGGLNVANTLVTPAGGVATLDNNGFDFTYGGAVNGSGSLVKNGSGKLTLGSANGYAGTTTIKGGTLAISTDVNLGAAPVTDAPNALVFNGGNLLVNGTATLAATRYIGIGPVTGAAGTNFGIDVASGQTLTVGGPIASAGNTGVNSLTVNGGAGNNGTLVLANVGTFNGTTVISNGLLQLVNSNALQNSTLVYSNAIPGKLVVDSTVAAVTLGGLQGDRDLPVTNAAGAALTLAVGLNNGSTTYAGNLNDTNASGSAQFFKVGTGTLTLTGTNSFTGIATVSNGIVQLPAGASLTCASAIVTNTSGARLIVSGGSLQAGNGYVGETAGGLLVSGGTASFTAGLNTPGSRASGHLISVTGGTLTAGSITLGRSGLIYNAQPPAGDVNNGLYINGGTANIIGDLDMTSGNLANSTVNTRVDGGSLTVGGRIVIGLNNGGRWSVLDVNGGTVSCNDSNGVGVILCGPYTGHGLLLVRAGSMSTPGIRFGTDTSFTADSGVVNLTGGALYLGTNGIIQVSTAVVPTITLNGGNLGALADWTATNDIVLGTATIQAADSTNGAHNITLTGNLSGGSLAKTGPGVLYLNGTNNTWTGNTVVSNGTLVLGVLATPTNSFGYNIRSGAVLDITQIGSLTSDGNGGFTTNTTATLFLGSQVLSGSGLVVGSVDMSTNAILAPGDVTGGTGTLTVSNNVVLRGTLNFEVNHGLPNSADKLVTAGTFTNAGATLNVTTVGAALQAGDSFQLFDRAVSNFAAVNLPALTSPLSWTNKLAINGSLAIISGVNTTPGPLTNTLSGTNMVFSWSGDRIGWRLITGSNLNQPVLTWATVAGSGSTNRVSVPVNPAGAQAYFRMTYP